MKRLLALTWKEFLQLKRDPITLRLIVFIPVMQTLVFGYAINYDVKHLKMVVYDEAKSVESRDLVSKMVATEYFSVVGHAASLRELRRAIDSARASVGLVIDRNFGKDFHRGAPARVFLIVDASDTTTATQAMSIAAGIANGLSIQVLAQKAGWKWREMPLDLRVRPWYNADLKTASFVIPGLIAIILTFTLIQFTASAIVRERERGTLEQLQVTPATRTEIILGKIVPFTLIGLVQLTMTLVLMRYLFDIEIQGSVVELYAVGLIFIAAVLGLGMLISTLAATQMQAMQMSTFFLLPFVFLSGYVFPIDGMPMVFQYISRIIPARYFIEVLRGIILRGAGLADLWRPVAWLIFYTVVIIGLAVARFKKTAA
jgi:ABC-2 type transport system permease protein